MAPQITTEPLPTLTLILIPTAR